VLTTIPRPTYDDGTRCRRWSPTSTRRRTSAGSRSAASQRHDPQGQHGRVVPRRRLDRAGKVAELYVTERSTACRAEQAGPGESSPSPGSPSHDRRDARRPDDPRPLPVITVDEPSLSMTSASTPRRSPGSDGTKLTARLSRPARRRAGRQRLASASRHRPPDAWEVQGRGELQLACCVETMRREGFELTVGKPQVVTARSTASAASPSSA
jgi:GTP-binding protein